MRWSHFVTLLAGVGTAALAGLAAAHHSQAGIFDSQKNIEVAGVIKTISWRNPHGQILLTATNPDGTTTSLVRMSLASASTGNVRATIVAAMMGKS